MEKRRELHVEAKEKAELRALEAKDRVASKKAELLKQNQPAQQRSVPVPAKRESKGADLPVGKEYAAFISHKKVCSVFVKRRILSVFFRFMYQTLMFSSSLMPKIHSKFGDSSSTLSRSLKDMLVHRHHHATSFCIYPHYHHTFTRYHTHIPYQKYEGIAAYFDADNLSVRLSA